MTHDAATISALREALAALPDVAAQQGLEPPHPSALYVPDSHTKALSLDTTVVIGIRGAGKSVWTAALFDHATRQRLVGAGAPAALADTTVHLGFSNEPLSGHHPDAETLRTLLERGIEARHIWRGLLARRLAEVCDLPLSARRYADAAEFARDDPEGFNELFANAVQTLHNRKQHLLLVFDSLDTAAPGSWENVRILTRGALQLALTCRPHRNIRFKFFIRPDMEEDQAVLDFPDSSKLLHNRVDLAWRPVDLYGLLFHILANGPHGATFRALGERVTGLTWPEADGYYRVPPELRANETTQRPVLDALAGPYMGANHRRGYTYTWITGHLADALGRIGPRSLLLALRKAAEITREEYPGHTHPLHYEAIKRGVAQASQTRVHELSREDYPWVTPLLNALTDATVPLGVDQLRHLWTNDILDQVRTVSRHKLPPRRFAAAPDDRPNIELLIDDLAEIGVLYRTEDRRINIPDIFRVGFNIKRKGGVRPPRRGA